MEQEVLFNLILVLLAAWICGAIASRFGYPSILGELAAGVIFGPPLLGILHSSHELEIFAEIGVFLLLLYIGMEVNYKELMRVSKWGHLSALFGYIIPLIAGLALLTTQGYSHTQGLILGLCLGITSLTVLSRILVDLKLLGTRLANVMIAGSLLADTLGLMVFGTVISLAGQETVALGSVGLLLLKALLFFGVTIILGIKVFPLLGDLLKRTGFNERKANFTLVILIGLIFAGLAEFSGLHSILGAFLAGLFLRGEVLMRKLSHEVTGMVHDVSLGFLAPIFFVMAGFHVDLSVLQTHWLLLLAVIFIAGAAKLIGSSLIYLFSRSGWREALVLGIGMNIHGAVEIIIAEIALNNGLISKEIFSIIIFTAIFTTLLTPILLKTGVRMLKKQNALPRSDEHRNGLIIAGAQPLARLLAAECSKHETVTLIDRNLNSCRAAQDDGLTAINGDVLDEDTLDLMDAANARTFISMTPNPMVNQQANKQALEYFGIPEIYNLKAKSDKNTPLPEHEKHLFDPSVDVREWGQRISRKETQRNSYIVEEEVKTTTLLPQLNRNNRLPLIVLRNGKAHIPTGLKTVHPGDEIIFLLATGATDINHQRIEELIRRAPIIDLKQAASAEKLFEQAADILAPKLALDADTIVNLLIRREKESSTVIVPGLAIPHIVVPGQEVTELLIARCKNGITFFDEIHKAHIIFIITGSKDQRNFHLRILSAIAQMFQDPNFENDMLSIDDPEKLRTILLNTDRHRF